MNPGGALGALGGPGPSLQEPSEALNPLGRMRPWPTWNPGVIAVLADLAKANRNMKTCTFGGCGESQSNSKRAHHILWPTKASTVHTKSSSDMWRLVALTIFRWALLLKQRLGPRHGLELSTSCNPFIKRRPGPTYNAGACVRIWVLKPSREKS